MYPEELSDEALQSRKAQYPIHPIFLNRWSPRSMTGEEIPEKELLSLFEAARWAPSSYNNQPWRYIYAKKETKAFQTFLNFLVEFNQKWAKNAAALVVMISCNIFEKNQKPSQTHSFDAGAAWENLSLEGTARGYVVHGMQGFDYALAKKQLQIPDTYTVEAMAAIGKRGSKDLLDPEMAEKEKPSDRLPLEKIVMEGIFKKIE